jgi:hypothetical protein
MKEKKCENCRWNVDGVCMTVRSGAYGTDVKSADHCDAWEERECCSNCRYRLNLRRWTFKNNGANGVDHEDCEGFLCMGEAFKDRVAIHMVGIDPDKECCEVWRYL